MGFFKKSKKEDVRVSESLEARIQRDWLRGEIEFHHQPANHRMRANPDNDITLGMLLNVLDISRDEIGDMYVMSNYAEMQGQLIQDAEQVWNYDLCTAILVAHNGEISTRNAEHVTLSICYKRKKTETGFLFGTNDLIIVHLRESGGYVVSSATGKKTFYICATVCIPPFAFDRKKIPASDYERLQGKTVSLTFAYDMRSSEQKLEEYKYIREDAIDKIKNNRTDELSDIQHFFMENVNGSIGKDFYFGKKSMREKSYGNAIEYFLNIFECLNSEWLTQELSNEDKYYFFESCYSLGFCYCEIKQYEKALYYLDIVFPVDDVRYKMEYINCLVNKKDFRAYNVVVRELDRILKIRRSEWAQEYHRYHQFLARRNVYLYIDMGRLEDAEKLLKDMLEIKECEDFALGELAYIQQIKSLQE